MAVLIFVFGALLALGLCFIAADFLKLPRLATQRAMLSVGRQEKKQARSMEAFLMGWAVKLAPHIHMDEYKRSRLKNTLNAAGMGMTPEVYRWLELAASCAKVPIRYEADQIKQRQKEEQAQRGAGPVME